MAILKVAHMGHPVLREKAEPYQVEEIGSRDVQSFWRDMVETMYEYEGVGLAAPQVHVGRRLVVVRGLETDDEDERPLALFNPSFTPLGEETEIGWEGCLSIPDIRGRVSRYTRIAVTADAPNGKPVTFEAGDFFARVIQHEIDHLDGVLYPDRMEDMKSLTFLEEFGRYWTSDADEYAEEGDEDDTA